MVIDYFRWGFGGLAMARDPSEGTERALSLMASLFGRNPSPSSTMLDAMGCGIDESAR
ncbi:hypothetical protein [Sorangium sp. So ce693]|uniref:hypothetical protein n=1 Tax=Sorangium sp. So ce693 TaxID=3133318 RepID=UPI003F60A04B